MKSVETVDVAHPAAMVAQHGGHREQSKRFRPGVIRREVVNPGIDQQDVRGVAVQVGA